MSAFVDLLYHPIYGAILGGIGGLALGLVLAPLLVRGWPWP